MNSVKKRSAAMQYIAPSMEIVLLSSEDAITTSPVDDNQGPWLPTFN